jgi:NAD(P)-dependent dehydrogenase (short-subunit alcohol dehydrogenase family)
VVTGGSRGIGRPTALRTDGGSTWDLIRAAGVRAESVLLDIASSAAVDAVLDDVAARYGMDILVNDAGVLTAGSATETSDKAWRSLFAVNADGTFQCMRTALRHMTAAGRGTARWSMWP